MLLGIPGGVHQIGRAGGKRGQRNASIQFEKLYDFYDAVDRW